MPLNPSLFRTSRGFTLIELLVVLAIIAILAVVSVPSFQANLERRRVQGQAELMLSKFYMAKSEALKSNATVYFSIVPGAAGCYGFKKAVACDCSATASSDNKCDLAQTAIGPTDGATLKSTTFLNSTGTIEPIRGAMTQGEAVWASPSGYILKTQMSVTGRVTICSPAGGGNVSGYPTTNC